MSTEFKTERMRFVSGSNTFTMTTSTAATPVHVEPPGSIARASDGTLWRSVSPGTWEALGSGGAGAATTGTMVLSDVSPGDSIDLRVSGTFDWLIPYSATPKSTTTWYGKAGAGFLFQSYQWFGTSGPSEVDTRNWTMTADTKDSTLHPAPNGILANMYGRGLTSLNHGYMFTLPCDPGWKRVIMQGTQHDDRISLSASFSISTAGSPQVITSTCVNGNGINYRFAIDFCGPLGVDLCVKVLVENNVPAGGGGVNHLYCHSIACWRK
jgi:hypothetical protein